MIGASPWNSLEVAKLVVGILTPIFLFVLGYMVTLAARGVEQAQWASRTLIEKRLELWDEMGQPLNDILVFFLLVGQFQEITPDKLIHRKRVVDRVFHAHRPLFSPAFQARYLELMAVCFDESGGGAGTPAPIRASQLAQRAERRVWKRAWTPMFAAEEDASSEQDVGAAYDALMEVFARDVGATTDPATT